MPARFFPLFLPFDTEVFISALTATSAIINCCTDRAAYIERVANGMYPAPPRGIRAWFRETRPRTCVPYVTAYGETGTSRNRQGESFNGVIVPLSTSMRLSVLNTHLPFLRPTDAKTEGAALSSTVVSILLASLIRVFALSLTLPSHARIYTFILSLIFTRSPILFRLLFNVFSRSLFYALARFSLLCSLIHTSLSFHFRRLVRPVLPTRFPTLS